MEMATPANVQRALSAMFALAGAPKLLGLAGAGMREMGYPAWFAFPTAFAELTGAYALHKGGELLLPGALLLQAVMGGAAFTMATGPAPPTALAPLGFAYGLHYVLQAEAQPQLTAAAMAAGVVLGLLLRALFPVKPVSAKKSK